MVRLILLFFTLFSASAVQAQIVRTGPAEAPISVTAEVPAGSNLVWVSGSVADPIGSRDAVPLQFGDTKTQTISILGKVEKSLASVGLGLGDVVMMRIYLVRPDGAKSMDFAGMMEGYRQFFGTAAQPLRPARSTVEVSGLVVPGMLVEIEVTAARPAHK